MLHAEAEPAVEAKVKLTVVYQNNTYGTGLLDAMTKGLTLNQLVEIDDVNRLV